MKIALIAQTITLILFLILWLHTDSLLQRAYERETQWSVMVDRCNNSFDSLSDSFNKMKAIAEARP